MNTKDLSNCLFDCFSELEMIDKVVAYTRDKKCCVDGCTSEERRVEKFAEDVTLDECIELCNVIGSCEYFSYNSEFDICVFCSGQPTVDSPGTVVYSMKSKQFFSFVITAQRLKCFQY